MLRRDLLTHFQNNPYAIIPGYVETSGGGAWTIDESINVSSITDNGTGDFTINWTNALKTVNYTVTVVDRTTAARFCNEYTATAKSTTVVRIALVGTNLLDPTIGVSVIAAEL